MDSTPQPNVPVPEQTGKQDDPVMMSELVATVRMWLRLIGAGALLIWLTFITDGEFSKFDFILPIVGFAAGLEGLVLRVELVNSGTLLKVHSILKPQRIPLNSETAVLVGASKPWWSQGFELPCIEINNGKQTFKITGSETTHAKALERITHLIDEFQPDGSTTSNKEV